MVEKEDILQIAELMRIRIDDHSKYTDRVKKVLEYFDTLDEADVKSEEIDSHAVSLDTLRDDVYSKFDHSLIADMKNYNGTHVRSPKMM